MKRKIIFLIPKIVILFALFSCSEEWLEPNPKSFFSPENVYIDKAGFESLLYTMRKELKNDNHGYINFIAAEHAASDLGNGWSQLDFFKLTPNSSEYYPYLSFYLSAYGYIKNANVAVSRIDDIEWKSEQDRNRILGEALWHRAYWFYRLVNLYGDVPFINGEVTGPKLDYQSHSRWAVLKKLQADLEFAAEWLPESVGTGAISKGAANHLLTKVHLANLNFDKAIETATKVINGPYSLMTNRFGVEKDDPVRNLIWDLHRPKNFNLSENTETICTTVDRWEGPPEARSGGVFTMRIYGCRWFHPQTLDSEGKPGMVTAGTAMYDSLGRGNANVRPTYQYQHSLWNYGGQDWMNTQDLRRADINWVDIHELLYNNPNSVDYGKPVKVEYLASPADTFLNLYPIPHYILYVPMDDPTVTPVGGNGDWYVYRLAETYLLRAEAYYWKNQLAEAANDINKVRARANAIPISPGEVTIDFIFDERARELFAEEPRHSELVRVSYIMAKSGMNGYSLDNFHEKNYFYDRVIAYNTTYTPNSEGKKPDFLGNVANIAPFHALWPVPSNVITANTMGRINQNMGYDGAEDNIPPLETIE